MNYNLPNKKHLVFVDLAIDSFYYAVNLGVAALIPIAKNCGFKVSLIYLNKKISAKKFKDRIKRLNPDLVGFSLMWPQINHLINYSQAIADLPGILKICGGPGASLAPETVLNKAAIDGVTIGEGEIPLTNLLKKINQHQDISDLAGFYWKINGQIKKNPPSAFITDLSTLPFPDYSLYPRSLIIQYEGKNISAKLTRGCPFACTYCSNKELSQLYPPGQHFFRLPPIDYAINLLKNLIRQYPQAGQINFADETLTANKEWFKNFLRAYAQNIKLPYTLMTRMDTLDSETIKLMKTTGCFYIWVGLESGNESFRKQLLGRHYSNQQFIANAKLVKQAGIQIYTFNMFALPFETAEQMAQTVQLNKDIRADRGQCSFYYPFPGTQMYELCKKNNLLLEQDSILNLTNYNSQPAIKLVNTTKEQCLHYQGQLVNYFANQEANPYFRMDWYRAYEEDGSLKTSLRLSLFYSWAKIKYAVKMTALIIDRQIGKVGIFLKKNYPTIYQRLKKTND